MRGKERKQMNGVTIKLTKDKKRRDAKYIHTQPQQKKKIEILELVRLYKKLSI